MEKTVNKNKIIKLAREAGFTDYYPERLTRFAALVAAKREWVDLTDYEIVRLYDESPMCDSEMIAFACAVITAFKEKNK